MPKKLYKLEKTIKPKVKGQTKEQAAYAVAQSIISKAKKKKS